jgi:hypothetical protein
VQNLDSVALKSGPRLWVGRKVLIFKDHFP